MTSLSNLVNLNLLFLVFIYILGFLFVLFAFLLILTENTVHSILYLMFLFLFLTELAIITKMEFLALIFIIVYIGAVCVLMLFHIKLIKTFVHRFDNMHSKHIFLPVFLISIIVPIIQLVSLSFDFPEFHVVDFTQAFDEPSFVFIKPLEDTYINFPKLKRHTLFPLLQKYNSLPEHATFKLHLNFLRDEFPELYQSFCGLFLQAQLEQLIIEKEILFKKMTALSNLLRLDKTLNEEEKMLHYYKYLDCYVRYSELQLSSNTQEILLNENLLEQIRPLSEFLTQPCLDVINQKIPLIDLLERKLIDPKIHFQIDCLFENAFTPKPKSFFGRVLDTNPYSQNGMYFNDSTLSPNKTPFTSSEKLSIFMGLDSATEALYYNAWHCFVTNVAGMSLLSNPEEYRDFMKAAHVNPSFVALCVQASIHINADIEILNKILKLFQSFKHLEKTMELLGYIFTSEADLEALKMNLLRQFPLEKEHLEIQEKLAQREIQFPVTNLLQKYQGLYNLVYFLDDLRREEIYTTALRKECREICMSPEFQDPYFNNYERGINYNYTHWIDIYESVKNPQLLGRVIYSELFICLMIGSFILFVGMLGSIFMTLSEKKDKKFQKLDKQIFKEIYESIFKHKKS